MSGVGVSGMIANLPNTVTPYPVLNFLLGLGGLRTVPDNAARDAILPQFRVEGMLVYSESTQCFYELNPDLTTWKLLLPSPALQAQLDWYVDAAGSVDNTGHLGNPIPFEELTRRICPNGTRCMLTNDPVVHVAAGTPYGYEYLGVGSGDGGVHTLKILCDITSSAPITLTAVVQSDAATKTRGELTTTAGTFVNHKRIRLVSGASTGAIAYSTGLHANAQNTYVSGFITPNTDSFHLVTPPAVGDTCVVDTLGVVFGRIELNCGPGAKMVVQDAQIVRATVNGVSVNTPSAEGGGNVTFSGCAAVGTGSAWDCHAGGANVFGCCVVGADGPFGTSTTVFEGEGWLGWGNVVQGRMGTGQGSFLSYGLCIDGGRLVIGVNPFYNPHSSGSSSRFAAYHGYDNAGAIEVENGPCVATPSAPAVWIAPGSVMQQGIPIGWQWGASGAYAIGYELGAGSWIYCENVVVGSYKEFLAIPSTINVRAAGLDFAYSDHPIVIENYSCGITAANFSAEQNLTDGGFYLENQNASVSATSFANIITGGQYVVTAYIATTTADAGSTDVPVLNMIFVDDSGVSRTQAVVTGHALTTLGGAGGQIVVELNDSTLTPLQWSITGVSAPGSAKFSVRCRVEYKAFGP